MSDKNKAGRKSNAEAKDLQSMIDKSEWEVRKFGATCCNDLAALYAMQRNMAFGIGTIGKNCSASNRKTSIDQMIERGESFAHGTNELLATKPVEEDAYIEEVVEAETKKVGNGGDVVLSYAEKVALHRKKQAEEKAE